MASRRRQDLRKLYAAEVLSGAGDGIFWVSLIVTLAGHERFGLLATIAALARLGPRALLSVPMSRLFGKIDLRTLLVTVDLARGLLMVAIGALVAWGVDPLIALAIVLVSYVIGVPTRPGLAIAMPNISGETQLAAANATLSTFRQVMTFVGPFAGVGVVALSPSLGYIVNGTTFVASAALLMTVHGLRIRSAGDSDRIAGDVEFDGLHHAKPAARAEAVPALLALFFAMYFVRGSEMVLHVLVVKELLDSDAKAIGWLGAAAGAGAMAAMWPATRLCNSDHAVWPVAIAIGLTALPTGLLALVSGVGEAAGLLVLVGAGMVIFEVIAVVAIQRTVAPDLLGNVFGSVNAWSNAGKLVGALVTPMIVAAIDISGALVAVAATVVVAAAATAPTLLHLGRLAAARRRQLAPTVAVLSQLGIFENASPIVLERLATVLTIESTEPGDVLIREGEAPDDLFVSIDANFDVTVSGRHISEVHPHDWFGEIGLLQRVARTATVRATTAGTVWRIPGATFLATLEESGAPPSALVEGIADRLRRG